MFYDSLSDFNFLTSDTSHVTFTSHGFDLRTSVQCQAGFKLQASSDFQYKLQDLVLGITNISPAADDCRLVLRVVTGTAETATGHISADFVV